MMSKKAGRKPSAEQSYFRQFLPIPVFNISHQLIFVRGAKRVIKDDEGNVIYDAQKSAKSSTPYIVYKKKKSDLIDDLTKIGVDSIDLKKMDQDELIETYKSTFPSTPFFMDSQTEKELKKELEQIMGVKKIKFNQQKIDLPKKCPSCEREGTATFYRDRRKENKKKPTILIYSHSTRPKVCRIGEWAQIIALTKRGNYRIEFKLRLKKDIHPEKIGYRYWIMKNKQLEFPLKNK